MLSWEDELSREDELSQHEEKSVVDTFIPALQRIQETAPNGMVLLRVLSFFNCDGIPICIFQQGYSNVEQEDEHKLYRAEAVVPPKAAGKLRRSVK